MKSSSGRNRLHVIIQTDKRLQFYLLKRYKALDARLLFRRSIKLSKFNSKKLFLGGLLAIIIVGVGTYLYQFPVKKYIAEQKLYSLLEEDQGILKEEIHVTNVLKDYKSARGGVVLYFNVSNSPFDYQYDYSLEDDNWMRGYNLDGYRITSEKIIFDEQK